jgi:acetyl-CoA C-acetyltransferase
VSTVSDAARVPVIAGVGQVVNRLRPDEALEDRPEPVELAAQAIEAAAVDCGGRGAGQRLVRRATSLAVPRILSFDYSNPAWLVAKRLGIEPAELATTTVGGNSAQMLVARACAAIAAGELEVAIVAGAECIRTRVAAHRHPSRPVLRWGGQAGGPDPVVVGIERDPLTGTERGVGLDRPVKVYPLIETAWRSARAIPPDQHRRQLGELWARFAAVAANNPFAWSRSPRSPEEIVTPGPDNPMVAYPYTKLLVANDRVDLGAALVICSLAAALDAGVPRERLVFAVSAAEAVERWHLTHRFDLSSSPAIRAAGRAALDAAGIGPDDLAWVDLYSCFPSAVEIAASELGLPLDDPARPLTVTGGLTFAGGPGNNYVAHAIATLAARLREQPDTLGLVTGVGWYMTKHAVGIYAGSPSPRAFVRLVPQETVDAEPQRAPAIEYSGPAELEAYTVLHDRDGSPERAIAAVLDPDGRRTWAISTDLATIDVLESEEGCGPKVMVEAGRTFELT